MKRNFLFIFLLLQLTAAVASAQIQVKKSPFASQEANTYQIYPQSALNTQSGETLIVWQQLATNYSESSILGKVVNSQGKTITKQIVLVDSNLASRSSVAYNPVLNEFLLAYDNNPATTLNDTDIFVKRLSARGLPVGKEVKISTDSASSTMTNLLPLISFNPATEAYAVIWLRSDGLVGALITQSGTVDGKPVLIRGTNSSDYPFPLPWDFAYLPSANKLIAVFSQIEYGQGSEEEADYWLATLDPKLKNVKRSNIAKINDEGVERGDHYPWSACLSIGADDPGMVFYVDNNNVKRRKIDSQGKLSGPAAVAFNAPLNKEQIYLPSVAFSTNSKGTRGILIATGGTSHSSTSWAQVLDENGKPLGAPVELHATTFPEDHTFTGVVRALPGKPTDTFFRFNWYPTLFSTFPLGKSSEIRKFNLKLNIP